LAQVRYSVALDVNYSLLEILFLLWLVL
jgi:hypothetical protein